MRRKMYYAYGSVLESLSFGLYPDKRYVLREFIQNAFDAINELDKHTKEPINRSIEIKIEPPSIIIADKGIGMSEEEVEKYQYLGYSEKSKDRTAGFRGIGKDSGLSVAEKIIVTTSKIDDPNQYTIVIDAKAMLDEINSTKNPPLEEILEKYSYIEKNTEDKKLHYTIVELYNVRKDSKILFQIDKVKDFIRRTCPVPFNPNFEYAQEIESYLRANIPDFSYVDIILNGEYLYKPYPQEYTQPEFERIFKSDDPDAPLIAFCWYCGHLEKGQFKDKENSGLIYRIKNFAVGDRFLTRQTLWKSTPERAFYFFGEIHIIDPEIVPSTDRTNFEDNEARERLYTRCSRIAQVLNQRAGLESDQRRLEEKTYQTKSLLDEKRHMLEKRISETLKPDIEYQIKKALEDLEVRLKRAKGRRKKSSKDKNLIKSAEDVIKEGKGLLRSIRKDAEGKYFYMLEDILDLDEQARTVYKIIIDCLKEELSHSPKILEHLIEKIDRALMEKLLRVSYE